MWADEAAKKLKNKNYLKPQKVVMPSELSDDQIQFISKDGVKLYHPCEIHKGYILVVRYEFMF